MFMKYVTVVAIIAVFLLLGGCSRVQVSQDYRPGSDFSPYHTYSWQRMEVRASGNIQVNNPFMQERFRQAIDQALTARGYVRADAGDFLVSYEYSIQTRLESEPFNTGFGYGWSRYHRYGGFGIDSGGGVRQYDVGLLAIDFVDGRTGKPLWRGTGSEMVSSHSTPEENTAFAYRLVDAILAQFPPR
jgi:hypothetical protein